MTDKIMSENVINTVLEGIRGRIPNHTKLHVARLTEIIDTITYLINKNNITKDNINTPMVIEYWFARDMKFNLKNIAKLQMIFKENIIEIMKPQEYKSKIIEELLADIPNHTSIYIEMEMLILSRISNLLEIEGWTAEKVNKSTPEIIRAWYNEQFDFSLLSIAKMEDALKGKIINVIDYSDQIIN